MFTSIFNHYPTESDGGRVVNDESVHLLGGFAFPRVDNGRLLVLDVHHEIKLALTTAIQLKNERNATHFRTRGGGGGGVDRSSLETWNWR